MTDKTPMCDAYAFALHLGESKWNYIPDYWEDSGSEKYPWYWQVAGRIIYCGSCPDVAYQLVRIQIEHAPSTMVGSCQETTWEAEPEWRKQPKEAVVTAQEPSKLDPKRVAELTEGVVTVLNKEEP